MTEPPQDEVDAASKPTTEVGTPSVLPLSPSEEQAFAELVIKTSRGLKRSASRWTLRPEDDVDDVVQETFIRAMRNWRQRVSTLEPDHQVGWLHRTLINVIRESLRRERPFLEPVDDHDPSAPGELAVTAAGRVDYDRAVRICLREDLTDKQRMVFFLDLADYNATQIGRMLGIASVTVRVHRRNAYRILKKVPEMKDMLNRYKEDR